MIEAAAAAAASAAAMMGVKGSGGSSSRDREANHQLRVSKGGQGVVRARNKRVAWRAVQAHARFMGRPLSCFLKAFRILHY